LIFFWSHFVIIVPTITKVSWPKLIRHSLVSQAAALSLPDITALDEVTMLDKPKGRYDI
jgi:hypothetical protein